MQRQRFHPQGHKCDCGDVFLLGTSNSEKNPGRDYYACANKQRDDPGSGCAKKFCWVDEYPRGFSKFGGGGAGRGRGGGGYNKRPAEAPASPRPAYAGYASAPRPADLPEPDFKRQKIEDNANFSNLQQVIAQVSTLSDQLDNRHNEVMAELTGLRDLVATMANDLVTAIKSISRPEDMEQ